MKTLADLLKLLTAVPTIIRFFKKDKSSIDVSALEQKSKARVFSLQAVRDKLRKEAGK